MMRRNAIAIVGLAATLALAGWLGLRLYDDRSIWPPDDYIEYWSAGRLNLQGENPYSKVKLFPLQIEGGRELKSVDDAVMMWNPPWTLPLVMPLGVLPSRLGQFAWLGVNLAIAAASALLLWNAFDGAKSKRWLAIVLSLGFIPTLLALNVGQISLVLLLGCAGFLWSAKRGYPFVAGLCAVLVAVKPHLAYLLWIAIAMQAAFSRQWRIVLGGVAGGLLMTAIAMAFNPQVWTHYFEAYRIHPPSEHVSLTLGIPLRIAFGQERFWLQFLPMIPLAAVYGVHAWNRRNDWNWSVEMPLLVAASFVTAPYGAWHFDLVLMLVPVLHLAVAMAEFGWTVRSRLLFALWLFANAAMLALTLAKVWSFWFAWVAPLIFLAWSLARFPLPSPRLRPVPA